MQVTSNLDEIVKHPEYNKDGNSIDLPVAQVNVYTDGMVVSHDYSCPVCRRNHAVLDMRVGIMDTCWSCRKEGYRIVKVSKNGWLKNLVDVLFGDKRRITVGK